MSINRTPHTFSAEDATSTLMNAEVKALWTGLQAAWDTYTPTWSSTGTAPSLGNGAISGRYLQVGKTLVGCRISLQIGSSTTLGTGFYKFSLPDALDWNDWDAIGTGSVLDFSSTTAYGLTAVYDDDGFARLHANDGSKLGPSYPFALNTSDRITLLVAGEFS